MVKRLVLLGLVVPFAVLSCADDPVAPDGGDVPGPRTAIAGGRPLVSGSVHIFLPNPEVPGEMNLREFTVNVVQKKDGSVLGTWHLGSVGVGATRPGLAATGKVFCVTIVDNGNGTKDAWIGGTPTTTNGDRDLGEQFGIRVRDVGKPQAGADKVSGALFSALGDPANGRTIGDETCDDQPLLPLFKADSGNLTIR